MTSTTGGPRTVQPRPRKGPARDPILQSKITVPALPAWAVPRPRIARRIALGVKGTLTSVTGPPGAGKTVAAASWAAGHRRGPVAWVTLDEFDNSPEVFWSYVVAALRQAGVAVPHAASVLARGEPAGRVFLLLIASALAGQDPPATLVLDEFHCVTDPELLGGLAYVLRNARPGLSLVGASRTDPPLPLHRYRLTGDLTEIRARDLAFTVPEVTQLMTQHGLTLPAASLAHLTERSEGWAAGLRMAAMSMADRPDPEQFVKNLVAEDSAITGYLVEEVLDTRPPDVRDLLLRTSIVDQVNADIAEALAGGGQMSAVLDDMARRNAFVQPVGQGWYRYHAWFHDVLQLKLRREQPQVVAGLHRRAADWYRRSGMLADAVRHATKAADRELAARIMAEGLATGQPIGPGHGELPADGFHIVPEADASPQLLMAAAAVALSEARDQAAEASLAAADRILGGLPEDQEFAARFAAATIRFGMACRRGELDAADAAVATTGRLLEKNTAANSARHTEMVAQMLSERGVIELWSGHLNEAAALFARATGLLGDLESRLDPGQPVPPGRDHQLATCRGYRALADVLRSRPRATAKLATAGNPVIGDGLAGHRDSASALARALVYQDAGNLSASRGQLRLADAVLHAHPHQLLIAIGCLVAARGSLAEGCAFAALEIAGRARHGWSPPLWLDRMLAVTESRAHAACGDGRSALDAARRADPESVWDARIALSRAWLAAGNVQEARHALAPALQAPAGETGERVRLEAWLTDALLSFRSDDRERGCRSLERALVLGEAAHLRLPFVTERSWMRPVLARHHDLACAHRQFLGPELVARDAVPAQRRPPDTETPVIVDPLTSRERDVLRHVSEMLDTADIAAEMHISVNTVKTHLKSIFQKLGAPDRRAAVRRARQLNLLLRPARITRCGVMTPARRSGTLGQ
jgi:LuxR family transcriptional regulator, maltose regulon positive regulatory protein